MCHLWPGLTPMNVWQMRFEDWVMFAAEADAWMKQKG